MIRLARLGIGFMWNCPWRTEWRRQFEYWDRTQLGPFYLLHFIEGSPDGD